MMFTEDEIIEMARQVARQPDRIYAPDEKEFLYYFAKLVADAATAKERVACFDAAYDAHATTAVLEAIRARGETTSRGEAQ